MKESNRLDNLDVEHCRLVLTVGGMNMTREFYFRGNRCISPLAYLAGNWTTIESRHFRFFISDSCSFNPYCIERIESFLKRMAKLIGLTEKDMQALQNEKIAYYLCKDKDEIEQLTGFRARGMCNLAYDAVVSTFSNHFHELLHLLIDYKLRRLPLYTHPFLQEGFAVAYGGRGGMESGVLLNLGEFLWRAQFVDFQSLLSKAESEQLDASLSYPAAGLHSAFLIETLGTEQYLHIYRKLCGSARDGAVLHIASDEFPPPEIRQSYLHKHAQDSPIILDTASQNVRIIFEDERSAIRADSGWYYFSLSDPLLLPGGDVFPGYVSKLFRKRFPGRTYRNEEYLIRATAEEISAYNLFTNTLIANYAASFSIPPKNVPRQGDRYFFGIRRKIFDDPIEMLLKKSGRQIDSQKREL